MEPVDTKGSSSTTPSAEGRIFAPGKARIALAFASDERGTTMLGVALYSLLVVCAGKTRCVIYILDSGITEASRAKMSALEQEYDCEVHFIAIAQVIRDMGITREGGWGWPDAAFGRFYLPTLLPQEERVLYLDVDILLFKDPAEILSADMEGYLAAGVFEDENESITTRKLKLNMPAEQHYFNSGVLVMNLAAMRAEGTQEKLLTYLKDHAQMLSYPDQDVLNVVLHGRVKPLHPRWNWPAWYTRWQILGPETDWGLMGTAAATDAALEPALLHFWGSPKPTEYNFHFYRDLYRRIWLQSPWKDVPLSGNRRMRALRKRLRLFLTYIRVRCKMRKMLKERHEGERKK